MADTTPNPTQQPAAVPKALRLANIFDQPLPPEWSDMVAAAAELRRLHELSAATAESGAAAFAAYMTDCDTNAIEPDVGGAFNYAFRAGAALSAAAPAAPQAEQPGAALTVEQAITALTTALRDAKGWAQSYSDAIIRDAIDRVPGAAQHRFTSDAIYAELPDACGELPAVGFDYPVFDADQMRAFADTTHTLRAANAAAPGGEAPDPLQGAANWLVEAVEDCETGDIASRLLIGGNRAKRLYDAAKAAQGQEGAAG